MYYHQLQHNQDLDIDLLLKKTENLIHFSNLEMKLMNCQLLLVRLHTLVETFVKL